MKRRYGRLDLRPCPFLTNPVDAEDRSRAISNVHHTTRIKSDPGCNAEITRKCHRFLERIQTINHTFEPAGDKHLAIRTERDTSGIRNVSRILGNIAADV